MAALPRLNPGKAMLVLVALLGAAANSMGASHAPRNTTTRNGTNLFDDMLKEKVPFDDLFGPNDGRRNQLNGTGNTTNTTLGPTVRCPLCPLPSWPPISCIDASAPSLPRCGRAGLVALLGALGCECCAWHRHHDFSVKLHAHACFPAVPCTQATTSQSLGVPTPAPNGTRINGSDVDRPRKPNNGNGGEGASGEAASSNVGLIVGIVVAVLFVLGLFAFFVMYNARKAETTPKSELEYVHKSPRVCCAPTASAAGELQTLARRQFCDGSHTHTRTHTHTRACARACMCTAVLVRHTLRRNTRAIAVLPPAPRHNELEDEAPKGAQTEGEFDASHWVESGDAGDAETGGWVSRAASFHEGGGNLAQHGDDGRNDDEDGVDDWGRSSAFSSADGCVLLTLGILTGCATLCALLPTPQPGRPPRVAVAHGRDRPTAAPSATTPTPTPRRGTRHTCAPTCTCAHKGNGSVRATRGSVTHADPTTTARVSSVRNQVHRRERRGRR